jgi:hypothetical protein
MNRSLRYTVAVAAVLAVSSCTGQAAPKASPSARTVSAGRPVPKTRPCRSGHFHWGRVTQKDTLVAVSDAHHENIPAGKKEKFTYRLVPVRTFTSAVTPSRTGAAVNAQAAVTSLESETGLDLAKIGTPYTLGPGQKTLSTTSSGKSTGVLVAVVAVNAVEAPFLYGCRDDGTDGMRGTLTTWEPGPSTSLVKCGINEALSRPEVEAEALMCGQTSRN